MKTVNAVLCFLLCFFLTACSTLSHPTPQLELTIAIAADANPDVRGRPSPVVLHLLQLGNDRRFGVADYLALLRDPDAELRQTLVTTQRIEPIAPGDTRRLAIDIDRDARFIGVIAELAQFDAAQTRAAIPCEIAQRAGRLQVTVDDAGVHVAAVRREPRGMSRFNED